jgi:hypothetical protein
MYNIMKYIIALAGIIIIALKATGFSIDIPSLGIYVFISIILLVKDYGSLKKIKGFGVEFEFNRELRALAAHTEKIESGLSSTQKTSMTSAPLANAERHEDMLDDLLSDEDLDISAENSETSGHKEILSQDQIDSLLAGAGESPETTRNGTPQKSSLFSGEATVAYCTGKNLFNFEGNNPKLILLNLSNRIENTLQTIISTHIPGSQVPLSPSKMMEKIVFSQRLDTTYRDMFNNFWQLRNKVVHGKYENIGEDKIVSLIDSGIRILKILQTIEHTPDSMHA